MVRSWGVRILWVNSKGVGIYRVNKICHLFLSVSQLNAADECPSPEEHDSEKEQNNMHIKEQTESKGKKKRKKKKKKGKEKTVEEETLRNEVWEFFVLRLFDITS